jgi:uncharacterized protein (TIGR03437 family)
MPLYGRTACWYACLLATIIPAVKAQSPNITGTWTGQLTEPADPLQVTIFPFEMDLVENADGEVAGITSISSQYNGAQYSAVFSLIGQVENGTLTFQDSFLSSPGAPPGAYWCTDSGQLTFSIGLNSATLTGPWQGTNCPAGGMIMVTRTTALQTTGAVVNGASFLSGIAPNSWVTIQGVNLSQITDTWDRYIVKGNLPTVLDGVSVSIGGELAYVYYVSPGQINALAPDVGTGQLSVTVTNPNGTTAPATVVLQAVAPAFFLWASKYAVATRRDFSWAVENGTFQDVTTTPAKPGDAIILWGTGFGPTDPAAPPGVQVPTDKTYATLNPVTVKVGGVAAQVYGAALAPGFAGLYQVAIQVPLSVPDGDLPVVATVRGVQTPSSALITVRQ